MESGPNLDVPQIYRGKQRKPVAEYIKRSNPTVLRSTSAGQNMPSDTAKYGIRIDEPISEAERTMHELWLAKRQQEAFEWKARQNVDIVMDRRSLDRSRAESEVLRRWVDIYVYWHSVN